MRKSLVFILVLGLVLFPLHPSNAPSACSPDSLFLPSEDIEAPEIILLTPSNGSIVQPFTWINFSITDNESVSHVLYWWNVGMLENDTLDAPYSLMARTSEESHYLIIYANDTSGNWASKLYYFITDATAPEIILEAPLNMSINPSSTLVNVTVTDLHLDTVLYSWDRSINYTLPDPYDTTLLTPDGQHQLNLYANDSAGNWGREVFTLVTDDFPPAIIVSKSNESIVASNSTIGVEVVDASPELVEYWWNTEERTSGTWTYFEVTVPQGESMHTLHILANDSLGRTTNQTFLFQTDNTLPSIIVTGPENNTVLNSGPVVAMNATDLHLDTFAFAWDDGPYASGVSETLIPAGDGMHTLTVYAIDTAGNWARETYVWIVDDTAPEVSQPSDMTVVVNVTGRLVTWIPTEVNPSEYAILLNGTQVASGSYVSGVDISVEVDSSDWGILNYTIVIWDDAGNQNSDQVIVRVQLPSVAGWLPTLLAIVAVVSVAVSVVSVILLLKYRSLLRKK